MSSEYWELRRIDSLGPIITGKTPSSKNPEHFDGPFPFITIPDLEHKLFMDETERSISNAGAEKLKNSVIPKNSVCVSCIATIGRVGLTTKPSITNQQINSIVCNDDVDPVFLYYAMCHFSHALKFFTGGGAVVANISKSLFGKMEIFLPPFVEQKSIGEKLLLLDKLIEKNKRISEVGSEFIQTLFRSWFIDFDPVKAKAEGKLPYGMDEETAALFPNRFEDSEIGPIPSGWKLCSILELGDFVNGVASQKYPVTSENDSLPVVKIREMQNGVTEKSDWASTSTPQKYHINEGDVLFSWAATLLVQHWQGNKAILNQHIFKVTSSENFPEWFVYQYLTSELWKFQRMASAGETMMGHIKRKDLQQHLIVIPPNQLLKKLSETMNPLYRLSKSISINQKHITSIRDALLPRLMSGELKVN